MEEGRHGTDALSALTSSTHTKLHALWVWRAFFFAFVANRGVHDTKRFAVSHGVAAKACRLVGLVRFGAIAFCRVRDLSVSCAKDQRSERSLRLYGLAYATSTHYSSCLPISKQRVSCMC